MSDFACVYTGQGYKHIELPAFCDFEEIIRHQDEEEEGEKNDVYND